MKRGFAAVLAGAWIAAMANPAPAQKAIPTLSYPTRSAMSPRLSLLPRAQSAGALPQLRLHPRPLPLPQTPAAALPLARAPHARLQKTPGAPLTAQPGPVFAGLDASGGIPPDANIAVGTSNIVELVNDEVAVFDKSGVLLDGYPKALGSLWAPLGGGCATQDAGDPIVQYDALADDGRGDGGTGRWLITQLGSLVNPFAECVAVSSDSDPASAYHLYSYSFGDNLNDYPKFGVWPTPSNGAYLASYNLFANGRRPDGASLCAYDRGALLAGAANPAQLCTTVPETGFLPADLDGIAPPDDGTPGYFLNFASSGILHLYQLSPDFAAGSLGVAGPTTIAVAPFAQACNGGACIPQPFTNRRLDSLGDRLMYRLAYRPFARHAAMVVNHSVAANGTIGPRWYELRARPGAPFALYQSGTFVPDGSDRWMGSIAMDKAGDIALGYSESSATLYPAIAYTGRVPGEPLGEMETEAVLQSGGGAQTGTARWGDYTAMRVDPADDCTFWYTNEYYSVTSALRWTTAIGSFRFPGCG